MAEKKYGNSWRAVSLRRVMNVVDWHHAGRSLACSAIVFG
jgi:hypothetical protein